MNCQTIQNRILQLTDPRHVPSALREHIDTCPACQAWWARAARLEGLLAALPAPAPPGDKKFALIDELTAAGPVIKSVPRIESHPSRLGVWAEKFGYARLAGLAAALFLAVGAWWAFTRTPTNRNQDTADSHRPHPLLEKLVGRNKALARAESPRERLELLGAMADDLHAETRSLAQVARPDELRDLSLWFDQVVNDGLVRQAGKMPAHAMAPAEREKLLEGLANKLGEARREADEAARTVAPASQPALKRIADTAAEGQKKLREMARVGA